MIAGALPDAELLLIGQGSHAEALRRRAAASPAADRIRLVGSQARESLPAFYQAADLFLFASETETQGLVLAEAHACGLPAVAVRASGVEEVVMDGETGILTKPDGAGPGRRRHRPAPGSGAARRDGRGGTGRSPSASSPRTGRWEPW